MARQSGIEYLLINGRIIKVLSDFKIGPDGQFPNQVRGRDIESDLVKRFEWDPQFNNWVDHGVEQ